MKLVLTVVLAACLTMGASGARAVVLDFNAFVANGVDFNSIAEDGFNIAGSGTGGHYISTGGASFCGPPCPQNGTKHLMSTGDIFTVTAQGGGAFSVTSFEGAESFQGVTSFWAEQIEVTGVRADASVVVETFTLDFIQDGDGALNDFQLFLLANMTNLVSVSFAGIGPSDFNFFDLDNITLEAVIPLPAAMPLFGAGLLFLGFIRRRRRNGL